MPRSAHFSLGHEPELALVPDRENTYLVAQHDEAVQRDIAARPVGDGEPAQLPFETPADQRMRREARHRRPNRVGRAQGRRCSSVALGPDRELKVIERPGGVDYFCHGFGRASVPPRASRSIQWCTSSARYTAATLSISASAASALRTRLRT